MQIFNEIGPLKAFLVEKRLQSQRIGFVPTMGALHEGHLALIRASQNENQVTVCSIYVNPTQFNNPIDLQKYPRMLEQDIEKLNGVGCDVLFCPENEVMYNRKNIVRIDFGPLERVMEGEFRPGHFNGVGLVVSKLFHIVEPDRAYFGQKDWQQFAIIRQLAHELKFNIQIKSVPTLREPDGLAMSSRNMRLTELQRKKATILYKSLVEAQHALIHGMSIADVKLLVKKMVENDSEVRLEYFEVAHRENLSLLNNVEESGCMVLCIAAWVGDVRLIDNLLF